MKKTVKVISIILLVLIIITTLASVALAMTPGEVSITETDPGGMGTVAGKIIGAIRIFGVIVSVGVLVVLGVKYMLASPEGKADYKESAIPYIVGAVLIFGATQIAGFVYSAVSGTK